MSEQSRFAFDCTSPAEHPLLSDFRAWAIASRPSGGCRGLLIDPPWSFANYSAAGEEKNAKAHYDCIDMRILKRLPIGLIAAPDAAVFLWGTSPLLDQQIDCLKGWGCRYVGFDVWGKGTKSSTGEPGDATWSPAFGTGYVRRGAAEILLIGAFGEPEWLLSCRSLRNAFYDATREHSRKPDSQYERTEQSVPGPYCEIFSRTNRAGWISFGNEAGKFGDA